VIARTAAAALVALALAACSSDPAPAPRTLPPPPSPSPSAAAATPLALPPAARPATTVGASQFARFYLQVLSEAFNSGDVTQLKALSHPQCGTCNNFIQATMDEEAAGQRFEGGRYSVVSAEATSTVPGDALVDVFYQRAASSSTNRAGRVERAPAEHRQLLQMRTLRNGSGWVARGIRFPAVPR